MSRDPSAKMSCHLLPLPGGKRQAVLLLPPDLRMEDFPVLNRLFMRVVELETVKVRIRAEPEAVAALREHSLLESLQELQRLEDERLREEGTAPTPAEDPAPGAGGSDAE